MCVKGNPCPVGWAEDLPPGCPQDAVTDAHGQVWYRFVKTDPPTEYDFWSHRKRGEPTGNATECAARSLSMRSSLQAAINQLPLARFKGHRIAQITINLGDGVVLDKKLPSAHVDWWPCGACQPLKKAAVVA